MKFNFLEYCKGTYQLFTKCGYKVTSLNVYSDPRNRYLTCSVANDEGEITELIYSYEGRITSTSKKSAEWDVSQSDLDLVMYEVEKKWFNVRLGISGTLESSRAYDTEEEALKYRLLSDTDTINIITKIIDYGKEG